jgi:hypothetical protein
MATAFDATDYRQLLSSLNYEKFVSLKDINKFRGEGVDEGNMLTPGLAREESEKRCWSYCGVWDCNPGDRFEFSSKSRYCSFPYPKRAMIYFNDLPMT